MTCDNGLHGKQINEKGSGSSIATTGTSTKRNTKHASSNIYTMRLHETIDTDIYIII